MFSRPIKALFFGLRAFVSVAFACVQLGLVHAAPARLTVLTSDDMAPHMEFVQQLRATLEPGSRIDVVRLPRGGGAVAELGLQAGDGSSPVNAGVVTRGIRPPAPVNMPDTLVIAVGANAARTAIERESNETLLLAMLSRLDYESLKSHPAMKRTDRRVGVLLRDPSMADQLALVNAALPQRRRLGVVTTAESEPLLRDLERAAQGWSLQVETAPDVQSIAPALNGVLPRSDALIVLPDLIGDNQAATLAVLRAAAGAGVPVFGASDGMVRSGGLAAAVSTPSQLALQARALGHKVALGPSGVTMVEDATPATVRVNSNVARGLGLRLPDERELTQRVTGTGAR
ncbi:ABC transporter substrate binding protein [Variovorax sp. J22R133]|uniref:ABC transporter substrate-binding protein n=1 Tax=Variovorax brevis TaxID=3053503 RepID=UPI002574A27C|nr:ABC transporter substrate binding protein [Variovorax sp. J22R133]MDM0117005.1 ABC transporter substrate binding protein [Variovorax sp. J22R133]